MFTYLLLIIVKPIVFIVLLLLVHFTILCNHLLLITETNKLILVINYLLLKLLYIYIYQLNQSSISFGTTSLFLFYIWLSVNRFQLDQQLFYFYVYTVSRSQNLLKQIPKVEKLYFTINITTPTSYYPLKLIYWYNILLVLNIMFNIIYSHAKQNI